MPSARELAKNKDLMYDTSMSLRILFLISSLLTLLSFPLPVVGYQSPEEVFANDQSYIQFLPPPSRREVDARIAEQQRVSAERRQNEYDQLFGKNAAQEETTHAAAPEGNDMAAPTDETGGGEDAQKTASEDTVRDKLLGRLLQRLERGDAATPLQVPSDETLHSGAPLIDTGLGTMAGITLLLGAVVWTVWRAWRQEDRKIGR